MLARRRSPWLPYLIASSAPLGAVVLTLRIEPLHDIPSVLFLAAVTFAAWYGGFGSGLLAGVLSALALDYFFLEPAAQLPLSLESLLPLGTFLLVSILVGLLYQQRQRALIQAQAERERFRVTLASIGDAVVASGAEGRITYMNAAAESLTGWKLEEVLGGPLDQVFHFICEQPDQPAESPVLRVIRSGQIVGLADHTSLIRRDGSLCPIDGSAAPIRDAQGSLIGVILVFHDITTRHAAEERNQSLYQLTAALSAASNLEQVADAILDAGLAGLQAPIGALGVMAADGQSLELVATRGVSQAVQEQYAIMPLDAGVPLTDAVRARQPVWLESFKELAERYPNLVPIIQKPGPGYAIVAAPLMIDGRALGGLSISMQEDRELDSDQRAFFISVVHQCAQALDRARLFEAEAAARKVAEAANEMKTRFLAIITHELRTPLTAIKGFVTSLQVTDVIWDQSIQQEFLHIIDQEADNMRDLIDQLLDLSRIQSGSLRVEKQPVALSAIVELAAPQLSMLAADHQLRIELADDFPPLECDPQRISQVLTNLVGNAARYSPPGCSIVVRATQDHSFARLDISDDGPGIPPEDRDGLFEPFRQSGRHKEGEKRGAGLGLAISKGLIEAHGGRIWIGDGVLSGTTVHFTLPFAPQR